jgi:hypothetical protein
MSGFWTNKPAIAILVAIAIGITVGVAGVGALGSSGPPGVLARVAVLQF